MYKYVVPLYFYQLWLKWLSSRQRTRAFYGELPLVQVAIPHVATYVCVQ